MKKECELKYRIETRKELVTLLEKIKNNGFKFTEKRTEKDFVPDRKDFPCRKNSILLRFRQVNTKHGQDILLTLKEKKYRGEHKIDDESEFLFSKVSIGTFKSINKKLKVSTGCTLPTSVLFKKDLDDIQKFLKTIGWTEVRALNEKVRMYFTNGSVNVTIDEFPEPIGLFCELEAETPDLISSLSRDLSLPKSRLVTMDYGEIIMSKKEGNDNERRTLILKWERPEKKYTIFHTGPVEPLLTKVKHLGNMIAHRDKSFQLLYKTTRQILTQLLTDYSSLYDSVLFPGTGTLANETFWDSLKRARVLVLVQGYFGSLLAESIKRGGHSVTTVKSISDFETRIYSQKFDWAAIIHHETSLGFVNNLDDISKIVKKAGILFFVDGISSVGVENINCFSHSIDAISGTSGKGFASLPGVAFLTLNKEILYGNTWKNFNGSTSILQTLSMHKLNMCLHTPSPFVFEMFYDNIEYFRYHQEAFTEKRAKQLSKIIKSLKKKGLRIITEKIHQARTTITILFISKEIQQDFLEKANDNNFSLYVPRSIPNSIQISVNGNIPEEEVDNFCVFIDEFKM